MKHLINSCKAILTLIASTIVFISVAQNPNLNYNKFKQLKEEMATPNVYRTAGGAPGHAYYQNEADYVMNLTLNDQQQKITGSETIIYHNNSQDKLEYLWLQLDQNKRAQSSDSYKIQTGGIKSLNTRSIKNMEPEFEGGFNITSVTKKDGSKQAYTIHKTMMRINLDKPLLPGTNFTFNVDWWYNINNRMEIGGRSGYEYFEEDDNYLYTIAQFFPRMCVYNDTEGWQNKQFLGSGEFTLPFGDYDVKIAVPTDHVVAATGNLVNANEILSEEQIKRLELAKKNEKEPVFIVNEKEAIKNEKQRKKGMKTWHFKAENVRDFGWASSRKFIWDAMVVKQKSNDVLAMSFYPKEGNPLWEQYSTKTVAHTLKCYSKYTFDYPYPVAISVHSKWIGMEYPMICFNGGRPDEDGTYSKRTKYGMISVIIHEVGHNYFPMIINSDERQWTWMDEGLNTFLQYLTEQEFEKGYPSRRGPAYRIVDYMKGNKKRISPIMTNSESIHQFGNNAYGKPATAMNILRESIMGRELFDYAFKTYANRWMFKHPNPEDLFRTMEDASSVDLDWFWRGWFYSTDHVDISLDNVRYYKINNQNPNENNAEKKKKFEEIKAKDISNQRNKDIVTYREIDSKLSDFYTSYDEFSTTEKQLKKFENFQSKLDEDEKQILKEDKHYYEIKFKNVGGLVMPIFLDFTLENNTHELVKIPAEIWMKNNTQITKVFAFDKEVKQIELDPFLETADTDRNNNYWPVKVEPTKFELYQYKNRRDKSGNNPMKKKKK
ncbi:MAG: M1 family metallopeptidase [Bacteroidota bacterium]|nr:M1 family metallopeptidase [Bacteroidota bacterium]MEC7813946.1 M1 family metallopeptidase [Bacteroidota bacterium]MEC8514283.1 M1 family metallopeptidase [Bacteroidota bacterium]|tara:strand:- start:87 stop:2408 length:2322 start_codon:yes stop_codon:yes gene_type:complete